MLLKELDSPHSRFALESAMVAPGGQLKTLFSPMDLAVKNGHYPVIKALTSETFGPFSEKVGKLFLDINSDKLGKSIGLGIVSCVPRLHIDPNSFLGHCDRTFSCRRRPTSWTPSRVL